jgi:CDP-glucose 4,6-dehydratase
MKRTRGMFWLIITNRPFERCDSCMNSFWFHKKVLVTGAAGFVGSWLVKALICRKAEVFSFVRDPNPQSELFLSKDVARTTLIQGKLEEFQDLDRAINENEIDTVFHLGAQAIVGTALRNPLAAFEANIRGTYNLLEACRRYTGLVKRIVIASSDKAYGSSDILPYTEDMPLRGRHPYDVSKSCADLLAKAYYHTYQLPIAIARCGNIYGGGDLNWSRLIPGTIRAILAKKTPVIRSNGKLTRDYLYVQDVVDGYLLLAENLHRPEVQGQPFNFGLDNPKTVLQVVLDLQSIMGCTLLKPKILGSTEAEIVNQSLNAEKAKKLLGWNSCYSLHEGLMHTIDWYKKYLNGLQFEDPI